MIVTIEQANTLIEHAARTGEIISDDVARTIASWWHSPAAPDSPITACSHGRPFDPAALYARLGQLIRIDEQAGSDTLPELDVLRAWTLAHTPHLVVTTFELTAQQWQDWGEQYGESDAQRPDGVAGSSEAFVIAEWQRDLGDYLAPDHEGYPADTSGLEIDSDGWVIVPVSVEAAAACMVAGGHGGTHTGFYAQSYGSDPFGPGDYWSQSDRFTEIGPDGEYASRYTHPYTGDVEIKTARLVGLDAEQQAAVHEAWSS